MNTAHPTSLNPRLYTSHQMSVQVFATEALEVAARSGDTTELRQHIEAWQTRNYDPAAFNPEILATLKFHRKALSQKQYRCDGPAHEIERYIEAFNDGTAADHFRAVLTCRRLVDWCETYIQLVVVPAV